MNEPITTAVQLDALPVGTVVRATDGTIACRYDQRLGVVFGDDRPFPWSVLKPPAVVLWPSTDRSLNVLPTEAEVAEALHADACPEDPDDGETCTCSDYLREARIILALFAGQPTEAAVRADEAMLIVGHQDEGRGFDQLLREQLADTEVRSGYVAGRLRRIKVEALKEAVAELMQTDPAETALAGIDYPIAVLLERALRIESEG